MGKISVVRSAVRCFCTGAVLACLRRSSDLSASVVNMRLALVLSALYTCHCAARPLSAIVVGGSSGMGKAAAVAVASRGGRVLIASRSQDKLDSSAEEIRLAVPTVQLTTRVLDASDEMAVQAFAEGLDAHCWDALICTAAGKAPHGPIGELPSSDTAGLFASKFWTAHNACKHIAPRLTDGGAVALTAGVLNRRPGLNCSPLAAVNGALS